MQGVPRGRGSVHKKVQRTGASDRTAIGLAAGSERRDGSKLPCISSSTAKQQKIQEICEPLLELEERINRKYNLLMSEFKELMLISEFKELMLSEYNGGYLEFLRSDLPESLLAMDVIFGRVTDVSGSRDPGSHDDSLYHTFCKIQESITKSEGSPENITYCGFCLSSLPKDEAEMADSAYKMYKILYGLSSEIENLKCKFLQKKQQYGKSTSVELTDRVDDHLCRFENSLTSLNCGTEECIAKLRDILRASDDYRFVEINERILDRLYAQKDPKEPSLCELYEQFKESLHCNYKSAAVRSNASSILPSTRSSKDEVRKFEVAVDLYQCNKDELYAALVDFERHQHQINPMNVYVLRLRKCLDSCKNVLRRVKKSPWACEQKKELVRVFEGNCGVYNGLLKKIGQLNYPKAGDIELRLAMGKAMPPMSLEATKDSNLKALISKYNKERDIMDRVANVTDMYDRLNALVQYAEHCEDLSARRFKLEVRAYTTEEVSSYVVVLDQLKKNIDVAKSLLKGHQKASSTWYRPSDEEGEVYASETRSDLGLDEYVPPPGLTEFD